MDCCAALFKPAPSFLLKWLLLCGLFTCSLTVVSPCCGDKSLDQIVVDNIVCCLDNFTVASSSGIRSDFLQALEKLELDLENLPLFKPNELFSGFLQSFATLFRFKTLEDLTFHMNENQGAFDPVLNTKVWIQLPRELDDKKIKIIVFSYILWPNTTSLETDGELLDDRLVGVSLQNREISGLQDPVNITFLLPLDQYEDKEATCVFLNFTTQNFSQDGCQTLWEPGQTNVTCSCDHFTYFGVLLVSPSLSPKDEEALSWISLIGCIISLLALLAVVLIFITNKKVREDMSMKVHVHLAVALILLNLHFLPSNKVATLSSSGPCIYVAVALHYSLLATFSWMALEGFHLYLLLVKVFNIYVRRYLLKLSLVGWGVPAVIVSVVVIINKDAYGPVPLDSSNSNSTRICYIKDLIVKTVATIGLFAMVFLFNMSMLVITVRQVMCRSKNKGYGSQAQQSKWDQMKRDICTLLWVSTLLGITWGLAFFSFGYLTTPALYAFCILSSLQGFFIFLWFAMSLRKKANSEVKSSSGGHSTST